MKVTIQREELLPALQTINGVVERRQTLPILSNLLLNETEESTRLTATDMEVELVETINKVFGSAGDVTLPARKLLDICRALPENSVLEMSVDGDRAIITSGKSRFTLSTLPAQEYPIIEIADPAADFSIPQNALKSLIDNTAFAMAQQDVRYYLNGLLMETSQKKLRAVATDGHRLALSDTEGEVEIEKEVQVIVPRKGIVELSRLLEDSEEEAQVKISANHIRITFGSMQFTSKLIDGKFPDYNRVIPEESNQPVFADRELLKQSLTRASILSNEKYRGVRIVLEKNKLQALAHNPEHEEAEEELEVDYNGPDLEIGFNVSYLLDALSIIKTDRVKITMTDPNNSCLILPDQKSTCKYVVMPMRL